MSEFSAPSPHDPINDSTPEQLGVMHDMEVITAEIHTLPGASELRDYLSQPATESVRGADGQFRLQDTGITKLNVFNQEMQAAAQDVANGNVGQAMLVGGIVNADRDIHRGQRSANLRNAFEGLKQFNLTDSSEFHHLLTPVGETVGALEPQLPDAITSEQNAKQYAAGAIKLLRGEAGVVMFNDDRGLPHTKLLAMRDPATGELLKNSFMAVWSGTFTNKDGTGSFTSNLATAKIIMIPDRLLEQASQPPVQEAEEPFDLNTVDWTPFQYNDFKVHRNDLTIDDGGWSILTIKENAGDPYAVIVGWDPKRGAIEKKVRVKELVAWQKD